MRISFAFTTIFSLLALSSASSKVAGKEAVDNVVTEVSSSSISSFSRLLLNAKKKNAGKNKTIYSKVKNTVSAKVKRDLSSHFANVFSSMKEINHSSSDHPLHNKITKPKVPTMLKVYMKANQIGNSLGFANRNLEELKPSWGDAYENTIDHSYDLLKDLIFDWSGFDISKDFLSAKDFCNEVQTTTTAAVCKETNYAVLDLLSNVMKTPWVLQDVFTFLTYRLFQLPLDQMFDWANIREFLHDIDKEELIAELLDAFVETLLSFDPELENNLPYYYIGLHSALIDQFGVPEQAELINVIETVVNSEGDFGFEVDKDTFDMVHQEICYILTMKQVTIGIEGACGDDSSLSLSGIPFCVDEEFAEESDLVQPMFQITTEPELGGCRLSGYIGDAVLSAPSLMQEDPNAKFVETIRGNGTLKWKSCKYLHKIGNGERKELCNMDAPEGIPSAAVVCASSCCHNVEEMTNTYIKGKKVINNEMVVTVETCRDLRSKSMGMIRKICKRALKHEEFGPAYAACPETCGICFGDVIPV
jgi:hypothetical protein